MDIEFLRENTGDQAISTMTEMVDNFLAQNSGKAFLETDDVYRFLMDMTGVVKHIINPDHDKLKNGLPKNWDDDFH
jgi:hypothetical protein